MRNYQPVCLAPAQWRGDKETEFGDLACHGLDVYAENAVLNQIQFPSEV